MVKINNVNYNASAVVAENGTMELTFSNVSIDNLVAQLVDGAKIEIIENNKLIGIYYNRQLDRIEYKKGKIIVILHSSTLSEDDKTNLELAIAELAAMIIDIIGEDSDND